MSSRPAPVRGRDSFRAIIRQGRRVRRGSVTVHYLEVSGLEPSVRVAYSLSRKVGNAVVRNRYRRRLRAIASDVKADLPKGDYLIAVSPNGGDLDFQELTKLVTETMQLASKAPR